MNNVLGRVHIVANTAGASFCICLLSRYVLVAHRLFLGCSRYVLLFSRRLEKKKIIDPNRRRRTGSLNRRLHPFRWRSAALGRNETNCSARWLSQSSWNLFHLRRRRIQRMGTCSGSWRGRKVRTACQWKQAEHPAHLVYSLLLLIGQNWLPLSRQCIPRLPSVPWEFRVFITAPTAFLKRRTSSFSSISHVFPSSSLYMLKRSIVPLRPHFLAALSPSSYVPYGIFILNKGAAVWKFWLVLLLLAVCVTFNPIKSTGPRGPENSSHNQQIRHSIGFSKSEQWSRQTNTLLAKCLPKAIERRRQKIDYFNISFFFSPTVFLSYPRRQRVWALRRQTANFFPPPLQQRSESTGIQRMRLHELWNTFYPVLLSTAKPKRRGYSSPCMKTFFLFRFSEMLIFFSSESRIEWAFVRVSMSEWGRAREVRNASSSLDWWTISPFSPFFSIFFSALATSTPTKEEGCRGGAQINSLPLFQAESAIPLDGLVRRPSSKVHLNADVSRGRKRKREPA